MYCTGCGIQLQENARFCSHCGMSTGRDPGAAPAAPHYSRLSRPRDDQKVAGVCAGFARFVGIDVTLVRIIWLALAIWPPGVGLILYIICWIVMPRDPLLLPEPARVPDPAPTAS